MELAVINRSTDPVVAQNLGFWVRAINQQMLEHFLPAYGDWFRMRGESVEHWPVVAYSSFDNLDPTKFTPLYIFDAVPKGELGSHSNFGGIVTARALAQGHDTSITVGHEANEDRLDHTCSRWVKQPDGTALAEEPDDGVESTDYPMEVEVLGDKRSTRVSNFVLPSWFVPGSRGPWDFISTGKLEKDWLCKSAGDVLPGCHAVRMDRNGNFNVIYGRGTPPGAHNERLANPLSRTHRRFNNRVVLTDPPQVP